MGIEDKVTFPENIPPPSQAGKASTDKGTSGSKSKGSGLTITQLENGLKSNFELLGIAIMGFDKFDGEIITEKAPELANALTELAKTNPRVRATLESLMEVGAWGGVASVVGLQIALPIAVHHNLLPDNVTRMLATQGDIPVKGWDNLQGETEGDGESNVTHITVKPNDHDASPDN